MRVNNETLVGAAWLQITPVHSHTVSTEGLGSRMIDCCVSLHHWTVRGKKHN